MARPSKLSPEQRNEIIKRLASGEGVRSLAREYGVDPAAVSRLGVAHQSQRIRNVAQQMADAQAAVAELPLSQQYIAMSLAEKLRGISGHLADAALHGARTSARMAGMAAQMAEEMGEPSIDGMRMIAAATKVGNDAATVGLALINASRQAPLPDDDPEDPVERIDADEFRRIARDVAADV